MKVIAPNGREIVLVNIKTTPNWKELYPTGAYCGRPPKSKPGHHLGNLFSHLKIEDKSRVIWVPTREEAIRCFKDWLDGNYHADWPHEIIRSEEPRRQWILKIIPQLQERAEALVCWCDPLACHTEILATYQPEIIDPGTNQVFYTGVGTRGVKGSYGRRYLPPHIDNLIGRVARYKRDKGEILRSGHAEGSDIAFEKNSYVWQMEIYLPKPGFNGGSPLSQGMILPTDEQLSEAFELIQQLGIIDSRHARALLSSDFAWRAHGRNVFQVIGLDINNPIPSKSLYCYTKDGAETGGTRTAILLAKHYGVKVINLGIPSVATKCGEWLEKNGY